MILTQTMKDRAIRAIEDRVTEAAQEGLAAIALQHGLYADWDRVSKAEVGPVTDDVLAFVLIMHLPRSAR